VVAEKHALFIDLSQLLTYRPRDSEVLLKTLDQMNGGTTAYGRERPEIS
jgi:hypothetical protein